MAQYELTLVLSSELTDEEVPGAMERFRRLVTERGGTVESEQVQGRRRFTYPIHKQRDGTYVLTRIDLPTQRTHELEAGLRVDERILRHLLIRV